MASGLRCRRSITGPRPTFPSTSRPLQPCRTVPMAQNGSVEQLSASRKRASVVRSTQANNRMGTVLHQSSQIVPHVLSFARSSDAPMPLGHNSCLGSSTSGLRRVASPTPVPNDPLIEPSSQQCCGSPVFRHVVPMRRNMAHHPTEQHVAHLL